VTLTAPAPAPTPSAPQPRTGLPTRIDIPAAGVRARVIRLGLNDDGTLQVPRDFDAAGWWSGGSRPGERGPAVIAGHVDSRTGPAVFYRLGALRRGDRVRVSDRDGGASTFAVQRVARYAKRSFPTAAVYGATAKPTLRLITCSGDFDASSGHYLDNTVVYATLVTEG
jgi:sortase (surface protein transpeptidase)